MSEQKERNPKLQKIATYVKEHKTMLQAILFMLFSCLAFVAQLGTQALFDWALKGVDKVVKIWPFPEQALGTLISFLIANVVAKVISFVMNRKKTFNANNNKIFSAVTYTVMVVTLIIVETLVGEPLAGALNTASKGVLGSWASTLAIIIYSIPDFIIVFLMDKYVIMRHKEEKKEDENLATEDEIPEEEKAVIMAMVEDLGATTFTKGKDWHGCKVYKPEYEEISYVGLPLVIFKDENGYRLSTADEALEYINETTDPEELEEPQET